MSKNLPRNNLKVARNAVHAVGIHEGPQCPKGKVNRGPSAQNIGQSRGVGAEVVAAPLPANIHQLDELGLDRAKQMKGLTSRRRCGSEGCSCYLRRAHLWRSNRPGSGFRRWLGCPESGIGIRFVDSQPGSVQKQSLYLYRQRQRKVNYIVFASLFIKSGSAFNSFRKFTQ